MQDRVDGRRGGAFSTRRLFTDQDEILFAAARPVILNGIEDVITHPTLPTALCARRTRPASAPMTSRGLGSSRRQIRS
jgi:hypothetical protein